MSVTHVNSYKDVQNTIKLGIKRGVPLAKKNIHYGGFETIEKLLRLLKIKPNLFSQSFGVKELLEEGNKVLPKLTGKILANPGIFNEVYNQIYDYLAEEDKLTPADVIFTFGSKNLDRAKKAGQLYEEKYAPWIYCSGSHPIEEPGREHEGTIFRDFILKEFDVEADNVIADPNNNSLTMVDNVRGFLNYCDELEIKLGKIISVITAHNLRRSWAIWNKYTENIQIICCSSGESDHVSRNSWFKNPIGIKLIFEEYSKIYTQHLTNSS